MSSKIYKLYPECKDYLWGGERLKEEYGKITDKTPCAESWELSYHKDGQTAVFDGRLLKDVVTKDELGKNCERFEFFPVLIKFIDAKQNLSVQVHPSDEYALKNENSYGKTEMWYIVDATDGAGIYCGFKRDTTKEEFLNCINGGGKVEDLLNFIPVKRGESYFISAGTVHAIGSGCLICEIQQNSNLTYRVYDYGRVGADGKPRELHVEKAVNVIDFNKYTPVVFDEKSEDTSEKKLAECEYFSVKKVEVDGEKVIFNGDSFTCVTFTDGAGNINGEQFKKGDSFFVPCKTEARLNGVFTAVLTSVPRR